MAFLKAELTSDSLHLLKFWSEQKKAPPISLELNGHHYRASISARSLEQTSSDNNLDPTQLYLILIALGQSQQFGAHFNASISISCDPKSQQLYYEQYDGVTSDNMPTELMPALLCHLASTMAGETAKVSTLQPIPALT